MTTELKRSLGLTQLTFYGVGTIVGAGIYSVLGAAAGMAGEGMWISLLLAGLAAFLTALSYAELISMYPQAGAEYHFLKRAFPRLTLLSFFAGFLIALNAAATSATVALAFGGYLRVFLEIPAALTAFVLLAICTVVNIAGIRESTWTSMALICVEVAGLLLLIGAGFWHADVLAAVHWPASLETGNVAGIFAGTALIFFIYIGFEDVANLAEETHEPRRAVPRALLISVALTTVIYLLVAWVALALISPAQLAASESPLTAAASTIAPGLGWTLAITAMFATASTALISLISISRLLFGMARDGALPGVLSRLTPERRTPWVAALALFATACALLPLGEVKVIASISALGILSVFVAVQGALVMLRFTQPEVPRGFRVPFSIGRLPLPPLLGIVMALALITQFEAKVYAVGAFAVLVGIVLRELAKREARAKNGPSG
ncbi:MAG: amino acid permease [Moraxellaceae bacterium]|jgi:APA family basic amino acid/polyamine antiporter|nr:amino acid permease [Moraxellaceae bacterium]